LAEIKFPKTPKTVKLSSSQNLLNNAELPNQIYLEDWFSPHLFFVWRISDV